MSDVQSARLKLPLLAAGQAQKEVTHNEALVLLDALTNAVIESAALAAPPANPDSGKSWLVANSATSAWAGQESRLAVATQGGWRFIEPFEGLVVWDKSTATQRRFHQSGWVIANNISLPGSGAVVDVEARACLGNLAALLASWGLLRLD